MEIHEIHGLLIKFSENDDIEVGRLIETSCMKIVELVKIIFI